MNKAVAASPGARLAWLPLLPHAGLCSWVGSWLCCTPGGGCSLLSGVLGALSHPGTPAAPQPDAGSPRCHRTRSPVPSAGCPSRAGVPRSGDSPRVATSRHRVSPCRLPGDSTALPASAATSCSHWVLVVAPRGRRAPRQHADHPSVCLSPRQAALPALGLACPGAGHLQREATRGGQRGPHGLLRHDLCRGSQ